MTEVANPESLDQRAKRYHRVRRRLGIARFALNAGFLVGLLFAGWSVSLRDLAWRATENVWLAVLVYVLLLGGISHLIGLPLRFYSGYVLEHRYDLSNMRLAAWVKDSLKSLALGAAFGIPAVEILYYTLRRFPDAWWLLCWALLSLFSILMTNLAPVLLFPLFYKFQSVTDENLRSKLLKLSERAGARVRDVMEWKLSAKSKKANAALVGLGNTRRIILADTMVNHYTPEEIEAVLAHELAHHVHGDIWKGITLQLTLSLAAFALADQALRRFGPHFGYEGLADFANLPLLMAASVALSLVVLPLVNGFSRDRERRADDFALRMIPDVTPFISSMNKLAEQNLAERRPHAWIEFIFHSHPSIEKRVRRAEAFREATLRVASSGGTR
jgi:STE24 endopeptidase